jgi:V8-like Glu-specific endopeptidase
VLKLSEAVTPTRQAPAFVIQHPGGDRKRVAYVRNQVTDLDDRVVHYLSDTQSGSSGSPVLNDGGRLIALHHAGGTPQEVAGKPPLKKNEGIRIERVIAGLKAAGIPHP